MSAFVLPIQSQSTTERLPAWALELARQAVVLRAGKKHCMLVARFDGLAWQLFVAAPAVKVTEPP